MPCQPLGIIVGYIGALSSSQALIDDDGSTWLLCDGAEVAGGTYTDLYALIGDTFGVAKGANMFRLPDLQGQFVRVLDLDSKGGTSKRDANYTQERIPPTQSTPQSYIGSVEMDAVPHEHNLSGFSYSGSGVFENRDCMSNDNLSQFAEWCDNNGAGETLPKNVAVNFIIRAAAPPDDGPNGPGLPVGSVVYYANSGAPVTTNNETWLACDGIITTSNRFQGQANATETELFAAIGTAFGEGDGQLTFGIADLRGYFIRGVTSNIAIDPDVNKRTPLNPNRQPAQTGSYQPAAVADHTHGIENTYGTDLQDAGGYGVKLNHNDPANPGGYQTAMHVNLTRGRNTPLGSDIRPVNTALTAAMLSGSSAEHLPIGTIVAYGGDVDPTNTGSEVWLICDGRAVPDASQTYVDLFSKLFSGPAGPTQIPDLRGQFLRGLDPTGNLDTGVATRQPMFSGGLSGPALTTTQSDAFGLHTHALTSGHYVIHHGGSDQVVSADGSGGDSGGPTDGVLSVASSETRPLNMYLNYVIRVN